MHLSRLQMDIKQVIEELHLLSPYGKRKAESLRSYKREDRYALQKEFKDLEDYQELIRTSPNLIRVIDGTLGHLTDISRIVEVCEKGQTLDIVQFFQLKQQTLMIQGLREKLEAVSLKIDELHLEDLKEINEILDPDNTGLPTFYIPDQASKSLENIRMEKRKLEKDISKTKDEHKEKLLELRNQLVLEEREEERRIRKWLTLQLQPLMPSLKNNMDALGSIDLHLAKVRLQQEFGGTLPKFHPTKNAIITKDVYHPLVKKDLEKRGLSFTPISINLKEGVTVITGANMGGKTVALRSLLLNLTLAHMGFYVFADSLELPHLDYFHFVYEDTANQKSGLSSFGMEVLQLKEAMKFLEEGLGVIAIDEFARGTNPTEGQIIVKGLIEYLKTCKGYFIITSHYDGILSEGVCHYQVIGLKRLKPDINGSIDQRLATIGKMMDYRLEEVNINEEVPKEGIKIAKLLGLESQLIDTIESIRGEEVHG